MKIVFSGESPVCRRMHPSLLSLKFDASLLTLLRLGMFLWVWTLCEFATQEKCLRLFFQNVSEHLSQFSVTVVWINPAGNLSGLQNE